MDYGAPLRFGSFITPLAADPEATVRLAVASEAAGLDLVTFQDHPYEPAYLDTVTLLSFVAGRTNRIGLAANVHNLQLRPPAVLARSAASLDRLSGGRFSLALGAGAIPDAAVGMGAPPSTAGQRVSALEEALGVIRALWDVDADTDVSLPGPFYPIPGAKRGPAPVRPIPIWLGAHRPRMLRIVGTLADGWLPSLERIGGPDAVVASHAAIDEAATAAGRDPRDIRRLLNVPPDAAQPERLADLALEHGFATFILFSDDPAVLRAYGEEVAPAVRERVAVERARR
ncbi:LLM class flavin-dependent oxidoreductase [Microbacterium betulae]|uniref:LLM class flavin-dependent oxidoreductase n=1 Tax=Microbacterium betulae TaxID=2981139 RepID=A0AA97I4Q0_9MICO|nr:LLM class flavin-dependent oxidoreductase [Microbacterium sp. AB]WOF22831.1 LLM class flavin-dependent oxidoreductase [Microbacterium sp. AB]